MEFEDAKIETDFSYDEFETNVKSEKEPKRPSISKLREWFVSAVDGAQKWREAAREDFEFVSGKQWTDEDIAEFKRQGRPAITINRIKPLINVLSGYQRLNRYDIDFLPRTSDDGEICKVRKGITKYVLDTCDYDAHESQVFMDAAVCGIGWFETGYAPDFETNDGEAFVRRVDPFGMYIDPEAHNIDFSDARFICRAKWVDKEALINAYPEKEDEIRGMCSIYDKAEKNTTVELEPLWNKKELKKIRLVECWYKNNERDTMFYLSDGRVLHQKDVTVDMFLNGLIVGEKSIPVERIRVAAFFDRILLEDIESPYEHNQLPFVPLICYNYCTGDIPAGFVRDLKDPQREINRRRIQTLHILNSSGNGGGFIEADAMTEEQRQRFRENATRPGYFAEVRPNAIGQNKIKERQIQVPPTGIIEAEGQATADLSSISGINEALMGTSIASTTSGRAIELKQKQAITHIAPMFDNMRKAKKKIAILLWGSHGKKGIIPQYYTEDKVYRVEGENGQQFIRVNEQVIQQDPTGNVIHQTLNDLSHGDFDIVIADTEASTTQRQAQMWGLVDAVSKLGLPGDMVFDIILDLSDVPNRMMIKQRWQERQKAQAQQAQQQMNLEMIKNQNMNQTIAFKDAPLPIQFAMAAKQGLIDKQVADYAMNMMIEQMFPQLAQRMAMQNNANSQIQAMQNQLNAGNTNQGEAQQNNVELPITKQYVPQQKQTTQSAIDHLTSLAPGSL